MAYFGKSNDTGSYTAASRELMYAEFSPQSSSLTSSISFKFMSNSVQRWIPSQSYLSVKIKVAEANGTSALASTRFRPEHITDYAVNRYFSRMSHTCNGVRVASNENPSRYVDGWADAHSSRDANESHNGVFNKDAWIQTTNAGDARTHVTVCMKPQLALWDLPYSVVTGENVLQLIPRSAGTFSKVSFTAANLNDAALAPTADLRFQAYGEEAGSGVAAAAAVAGYTAADTALGGSTNIPLFSIESIRLYCAFASPQVPLAIPPLMTHRLTTPNIQEISLNTTNLSTTLTIPSSTYFVQLYAVDDSSDHSAAQGPVPFSTSGLQDITIRLAGTSYPTIPYAQLNSTTDSDVARAYADTCNSRNRLDMDASYPKSLEAFARKPVINFNIYRAQDDNDTQLQIRATLAAAYTNGKLIVVSYANEVLGLTYDKQELVRVDLQPVV
jgi:hypothetical protein